MYPRKQKKKNRKWIASIKHKEKGQGKYTDRKNKIPGFFNFVRCVKKYVTNSTHSWSWSHFFFSYCNNYMFCYFLFQPFSLSNVVVYPICSVTGRAYGAFNGFSLSMQTIYIYMYMAYIYILSAFFQSLEVKMRLAIFTIQRIWKHHQLQLIER